MMFLAIKNIVLTTFVAMKSENKDVYVAIMAGGIGSRFWPYSRKQKPKQFLDALNTGSTLIQQTYERFLNICPKENIFIVTNASYVHLVKEQIADISDHQILREPFKRDTAPCIAYVCKKIQLKNENATIIVAPSDHIILKEIAFVETLNKAIDFVDDKDVLLTLGIQPTNPNTGYGYIQYDEDTKENNVFKVKAFTEKPNEELAKQFLNSGDFLWNSGTFIWKASSILSALKKMLPDVYENIHESSASFYTENEEDAVKKAYANCRSISIDYGIMEKAENTFVIPAHIGWSDIGTWNSLYNAFDKDYFGNAVHADAQVFDSFDNMLMGSKDKLVVLNGVRNLCIVDTDDVLMVTTRDREQEIKKITLELNNKDLDKFL